MIEEMYVSAIPVVKVERLIVRQWGLIPHWTKHPPSGGLNTINARSEGLL
jgi:putative SOS response-associated peptidase YedK